MRNNWAPILLVMSIGLMACQSEREATAERQLKQLLATYGLPSRLEKSVYVIIYPDGCNGCTKATAKWIGEHIAHPALQGIVSTRYRKQASFLFDRQTREHPNFMVDSVEKGTIFSFAKYPQFFFCEDGRVTEWIELQYQTSQEILSRADAHLAKHN